MWNDLEMEIGICNRCILEKTRKNAIPGKGNKKAKILFVMDSISEEEDSRGELLGDKKGEYFKKFLEYSRLNLSRCYFTTLTKCSSHGELIEKENIDACHDFLIGQIALLNPEYIIAVGENPIKKLLDTKEDIYNMVGKVYEYMGDIKIIPIYDKSYLFKAKDKEKWQLIKILEKLNEEGI